MGDLVNSWMQYGWAIISGFFNLTIIGDNISLGSFVLAVMLWDVVFIFLIRKVFKW